MADRWIACVCAPRRHRGAGVLLALLLLCAGRSASAQAAAPDAAPYPPPPTYAPVAPTYTPTDPSAAPTASPPAPAYPPSAAPPYPGAAPAYPGAVPPPAPAYAPGAPGYTPAAPSVTVYATTTPGAPVVPPLRISREQLALGLQDWRAGRVLSGVGAAVDLIGSGLSITGIVLLGLDYPEQGSALTLAGTGSHTLGFVLSASGLGLQHRALRTLGLPDNRGLFGVGSAFGIAGLAGTGLGIFFAATDFLRDTPNSADRSTAIAVASLGGSALYLICGILYHVDSLRMKAVIARLGRF